MNDEARRYVLILALSEIRWRVSLEAKKNVGFWLWIQPVDATDWLNRSAGVS